MMIIRFERKLLIILSECLKIKNIKSRNRLEFRLLYFLKYVLHVDGFH